MSSQPPSRRVGLARALSKLGCCSRTQAVALVRGGRVRLNGSFTRNPEAPVRLERDRIEVDGSVVRSATMIYLMMNKPRGVVTTAADEQGRATVYSLLPPGLPWIAPVGRLDKASEGLLLLTNDSQWAAKVLDPETHLEKTYHVQIHGHTDESVLNRLVKGVRTDDGERLSAKRGKSLRQGSKNAWLEIVLDEGKNRQIRRMLEALGIEVLRLVRVAIGDLKLGELPKGGTRPLTPEEKELLDQASVASRKYAAYWKQSGQK
jgi:23S rRNA pseudouridine2605 synthase